MKKIYETPELKITPFDPTDVIMTSTEGSIPEVIVPGDGGDEPIDLGSL